MKELTDQELLEDARKAAIAWKQKKEKLGIHVDSNLEWYTLANTCRDDSKLASIHEPDPIK